MEGFNSNNQKAYLSLRVETKVPADNSKSLWEEIRTTGHHPTRRSYHSAVMWGDKMVIYGGQDLKEGPQSGMWMIEISQFDQGDWEEMKIPDIGPLCRHTAVLKGDLMYLFGGTNSHREFNRTLVYNLRTLQHREIVPDNPQIPPALDSHSACLYEDGTAAWMIIFGGYSIGERTNNVYLLNLNTEKWKQAKISNGPEPRSNHSAIIYRDHMYIFGGTSDEGEKLNDLWRLDLRTYAWENVVGIGNVPSGRSGHSAIVFMGHMILFGGMKDITKETNDMYSYNFATSEWVMFQYEHQIKDPVSNEQLEEFKKSRISPNKHANPPKSPMIKKSTAELSPGQSTMRKNTDSSPPDTINPKKKKTLYEGPPCQTSGRIRARPPHPRDGHSAVYSGNIMIIFGGDRHQMPFNDCYVYFLVENTIKTPINIPLS
ncbi:hypothetical protein SteCoe_22467 [Stentor coeruleus]|uniref:Uncharacterized protein n=1 Tax=Stentor coeruleus TaxID=5963 RepID=A0A1R2BM81_9CILI|nr:hypothetical protein SteCoe_22467 [Stentor coeruleus]